ncbi:MAG: protein kinase domain-containing protein, partial [Planctomycetota bacterium]
MESESVFGVEPEQLGELLSVGEDDLNDSAAEDGKSASDGHPAEGSEPASGAGVFMEQPGSWIGPYKLLKVLGEGGMGIAYLAEQKRPMRRQVAIKVIKPGMDSRRVVSRFEAERQALALLDHRNIAHVYDAGTTELGRPYFVMEYVKGLSITDYCDHHKLTIRDRLVLFQQICHAVQHAHHKGIIHRDIKPSNILVSVENDRPTPKIIDFGVAKAIGRPLTDRTVFTEDSLLLGTPEYMSPEQADMATEDIDTRSDVYSLGVLLYVLLTGVLPFDVKSLRDSGIENIRKTIRETHPKTPSTRLTRLGEEAAKVAEMRGTEVSTLAKHLKNELEWIPVKAMRKERSERYRSASELADDVDNYLNGVPLAAGPPGAVYRIKKLVRRNAVLSAAVLAVAATLVLGLAGITAMYLRAEGLRTEAEGAGQRSEAVLDFLTDVLASARKVPGSDATVIDALDTAATELDTGGRFTEHPLTELQIRFRLGNLIKELGYPKKAIHQLERAKEISLSQGKPDIPGVPRMHIIMNYLALAYLHSGELKEAETLFQQIIQEKEETERIYTNLYPWVKLQLAKIYNIQARYEESEQIYMEMMHPQFRKGEGLPQGYKVNTMRGLADAYRAQGRYEQAEQMLIKALDIDKSDKKLPHEILAVLHLDQGRYQEAEAVFQEVIERHQRDLPGEGIHRYTLPMLSGLAAVHTKQGHFAEAASLFQDVRETQKEKLGEDHWETLKT